MSWSCYGEKKRHKKMQFRFKGSSQNLREKERETDREKRGDGGKERRSERASERAREREKSNSKTLFYNDLGSFRPNN